MQTTRMKLALRPLAALVILATTLAPAAFGGLNTYYTQDFTGQSGEGITSPGSYSGSNWSVDGAGTPAQMGHAQVSTAPEVFEFYDIGGTGAGAGVGTVQFLTSDVLMALGNPAHFSYLSMTLNASLDRNAFADGEFLRIDSLIDGNVVDSTTLTTAGSVLVTHNLLDDVLPATMHTYVLRVTAMQVQNGQPSFTIDNILVEGLSVPEPASMSLLGMGVAAMVTARYRRRQKSAA